MELDPDGAPNTVRNFLAHVRAGFYDNLIFHRVRPGFMIQAGYYTAELARATSSATPIMNESDNGVPNLRGAVAMARTDYEHSINTQFFINHVNNPSLDYDSTRTGREWGYPVFGRVIEGMDVVDAIAAVPTERRGQNEAVPLEPNRDHPSVPGGSSRIAAAEAGPSVSSTSRASMTTPPPPRDWSKAICGICPAGCWVEVAREHGKLVDIRADTGHPLGMICRRGRHAPEIVHSEHRLGYPMKRVGPKGTLEFERITWEEAYDLIVDRLTAIKRESGPEAVSIYTGRGAFETSLCDIFQPKGVAVSSASNVLFPFGSPNTMGVGALCYVSFAMIAPHVTFGRMLVDMFTDMENAEMLVVWGANPATDSPPLDMHRLEAAAARGADMVVIDPRRTETVTRTGAQWVPIRPGTDGALALGMLAVMIEEELYDETFANQWCHGFDELATYVQHFSPEVASTITGIPADTIRDLARRIAHATGACPIMYTGLEYSNSGTQTIRAALSLFALAGQLDVPGGHRPRHARHPLPDQPGMQPPQPRPRPGRRAGHVPDLQRLSRRVTRERSRDLGARR